MKVGDLIQTLPTNIWFDHGMVVDILDDNSVAVLWSDGEVWNIHKDDTQLLYKAQVVND